MTAQKKVILGIVLGTAVGTSLGVFLYVRQTAAAYSLENIIVEPAPPQAPQPEPPPKPLDPRLEGLKDRGDGARLFLAPAEGETLLGAGFSSNGTIVVSATAVREEGDIHRVFSMDLSDRKLVAYIESEDPIAASLHRPAHRNADALCFSALDDETRDIHCADYLGENARTLTDHDGPEHLVVPAVAPDGEWLAFEVNTDHLKNDDGSTIWKIGLNRAGIGQLTRGADDRHPTWTQDGKRLLFQRRLPAPTEEIGKNWDIYMMDADGKNPRPVLRTYEEDELWPAMIDDERLIMGWRVKDAEPRLKALDIETKKGEWLTSGKYGPERYPSVSPDGKIASFLAPVDPEEPDRMGVWLLQLDRNTNFR